MFHPQLPLGMPCYDLCLVTELTVVDLTATFGYSRLPCIDGRIAIHETVRVPKPTQIGSPTSPVGA